MESVAALLGAKRIWPGESETGLAGSPVARKGVLDHRWYSEYSHNDRYPGASLAATAVFTTALTDNVVAATDPVTAIASDANMDSFAPAEVQPLRITPEPPDTHVMDTSVSGTGARFLQNVSRPSESTSLDSPGIASSSPTAVLMVRAASHSLPVSPPLSSRRKHTPVSPRRTQSITSSFLQSFSQFAPGASLVEQQTSFETSCLRSRIDNCSFCRCARPRITTSGIHRVGISHSVRTRSPPSFASSRHRPTKCSST